jgi:polyhydroxybutyrate depolymerase
MKIKIKLLTVLLSFFFVIEANAFCFSQWVPFISGHCFGEKQKKIVKNKFLRAKLLNFLKNHTKTQESGDIDDTNIDSVLKIESGDYEFEIKNDNEKRFYLLHVPHSYNGKSTSLILAFHGGMGNAEQMSKDYDLKQKSDKEGFIVAFPNGASRFPSGKFATWNAGNCCGNAVKNQSDDVKFVKAIIKDIKLKANIKKIYAIGMSNGGMFSYRLACEMSDTFSAIVAVSGTNNFDKCNPKNPISIMHIHGLEDKHVLFYGGCGPDCKAETEFVSVPDTISSWVKRNNCNKESQRVFKNEGTYCDLYTGCDYNVQVKLCVVKNGGHSWPGSKKATNELKASNSSQSISANDEIWKFFQSN